MSDYDHIAWHSLRTLASGRRIQTRGRTKQQIIRDLCDQDRQASQNTTAAHHDTAESDDDGDGDDNTGQGKEAADSQSTAARSATREQSGQQEEEEEEKEEEVSQTSPGMLGRWQWGPVPYDTVRAVQCFYFYFFILAMDGIMYVTAWYLVRPGSEWSAESQNSLLTAVTVGTWFRERWMESAHGWTIHTVVTAWWWLPLILRMLSIGHERQHN